MKVVGFNCFQKNKKKKKKAKIFCFGNVFKNCMMVGCLVLFFMLFDLIDTSFTSTIKKCIDSFISSMAIVRL